MGGAPRSPALTALVVVPARLASQRLPRKMLLRETGRYLFEHTARNAARAAGVARVVLATDAEEIVEAARSVDVEVRLTGTHHRSGTDRVSEALGLLLEEGEGPWDVVINVQGDEPELPPEDLERLIGAFADPTVELATLFLPLEDPEVAADPSVVKVVLDGRGDALYFSRSPIPSRDHPDRPPDPQSSPVLKRHVGVYAFRPEALRRFCALPPGELERSESLEQLRWLEAGGRIRVLEATGSTVGIDTAEHYALFVQRTNATDPVNAAARPGGTQEGSHP